MEPVNINCMISELVAAYQPQMTLKKIKIIPVLLNIESVAYEVGGSLTSV